MSSLHNDLDMWANKARVRGSDRIEILNSTAHEIAETLREHQLLRDAMFKPQAASDHYEPDPKDALIRELMDGRHRDLDKMREMKALIRELVAALKQAEEFIKPYAYTIPDWMEDALAKAKEQGYEP